MLKCSNTANVAYENLDKPEYHYAVPMTTSKIADKQLSHQNVRDSH